MSIGINISSPTTPVLPIIHDESGWEEFSNSPVVCQVLDCVEGFCIYTITGIAMSILVSASLIWGFLGLGLGSLSAHVATLILGNQDESIYQDFREKVSQFKEEYSLVLKITFVFAIVIGSVSALVAIVTGFVPSFVREFHYHENLAEDQQGFFKSETV